MADNNPPENTTNGGESTHTENVVAKRQRRPSVRLGDIVSDETHVRRTIKNIKNESKSSKNRPLTEFNENQDGKDANFDSVIGNWRVKESKKRGCKGIRSNWTSRMDVEDVDNGFRDFDRENLDMENDDDLGYNRVEFSDTEGREWRGGDDGVRIWLNGLGLGRYAPVFEIHEVDSEVLGLLTIEDLKDMGINAVGSRRKMFCAIQKLGKGFS